MTEIQSILQIRWFYCILVKSSGDNECKDVHISHVLLGVTGPKDMLRKSMAGEHARVCMLPSAHLDGHLSQGEEHSEEPEVLRMRQKGEKCLDY